MAGFVGGFVTGTPGEVDDGELEAGEHLGRRRPRLAHLGARHGAQVDGLEEPRPVRLDHGADLGTERGDLGVDVADGERRRLDLAAGGRPPAGR